MSTVPQTAGEQRNAGLLFILTCLWIAASITGGRLAAARVFALQGDVVRQCVTALLLFAGFYVIARSSVPDLRPFSSIGFVQRPSAGREFRIGVALGWSIALLLTVPAALTGNYRLSLTFDARHLLSAVLSAVMLSAFAFSVQLVVAGLPSRLLVRTAGPSWTAIAMVLLAFCLVLSGWAGGDSGMVFAMLSAVLFTSAFLRTRAIWLALGMQLGWTWMLQLLFGLLSPYTPVSSGIFRAEVSGPPWLTGSSAGPETSLVAPLVLIAALVALFRVTRDYAWHYTYQPLEGAGYPVEVRPPEAHTREQARTVEPLVQIGGVAPAPPLPPELRD